MDTAFLLKKGKKKMKEGKREKIERTRKRRQRYLVHVLSVERNFRVLGLP